VVEVVSAVRATHPLSILTHARALATGVAHRCGVDCGARGRSNEAKAEQRKRIDKYGDKAT